MNNKKNITIIFIINFIINCKINSNINVIILKYDYKIKYINSNNKYINDNYNYNKYINNKKIILIIILL